MSFYKFYLSLSCKIDNFMMYFDIICILLLCNMYLLTTYYYYQYCNY